MSGLGLSLSQDIWVCQYRQMSISQGDAEPGRPACCSPLSASRRRRAANHAHSVQVFGATGGGVSWIAAFAEPGLFATFGVPLISRT